MQLLLKCSHVPEHKVFKKSSYLQSIVEKQQAWATLHYLSSSSALKEPAACLKRQLRDRCPLARSLPCPARIIQDGSFWLSCNQLSFPAAVRKSLKILVLDKLTMPWTRQPQEPHSEMAEGG